ncbi:DUF397 domain-containing protein [Streptomyces violascens]|uniref:DUF397 domain-containing protein n=1 Tax=Streptomyces violascens TaxID=67381 RepID=UPI003648D1BC
MDHHDIRWVKSSYSGGSGTECVETARLSARTAVRDSKRPDGARISFETEPWADFLDALKGGSL